METGLIAAIAAAAKAAREEQGLSIAKLAATMEETGAGSGSKVSRFESGQHYQELDRMLGVYVAMTDASLIDLLDRAKADLKKKQRARAKAAGPAAVGQAAKKAAAASQKAR